MERYIATQFYKADSPESRILGESGLVPSEFVLAADAQRALDVEREKVKDDALRAENARLRKALQLIVHGTQDEAPPWRCLGETQMQVIARDALQPERGEP